MRDGVLLFGMGSPGRQIRYRGDDSASGIIHLYGV